MLLVGLLGREPGGRGWWFWLGAVEKSVSGCCFRGWNGVAAEIRGLPEDGGFGYAAFWESFAGLVCLEAFFLSLFEFNPRVL